MKPCYAFAKKDTDNPVLSIYDDIGFWGKQANEFQAELAAINAKDLTVEISSAGGDIVPALAMYHMLRESGKNVTTKNMGVAASSASIVFLAGDKRIAPKNTQLMVHAPWSIKAGNSAELKEAAESLGKIQANFESIYAKRTGQSAEVVKGWMEKDTWLSAEEGKALGFVTEVTDDIQAVAKFDMDRADLPESVRKIFAKKTDPVDPPKVGVTIDQIKAALKTAELPEDLSTTFMIAYDSMEKVNARIAEAKTISDICAVAKAPELTAKFLKAGTSVADVRAQLMKGLSKVDESTVVDTIAKARGNPEGAVKGDDKKAHLKTPSGYWNHVNSAKGNKQ